MARLAIFIDGGYINKLCEEEFSVRIDYQALSEEIRNIVAAKTPDPVDILRTHYYHCLPYQSNPPTEAERRRFSQMRRFFTALQNLPRFVIREGRLVPRGYNSRGEPIFQQKGVDLCLGLDFALLSGKRQISHAAVLSGDSDLVPAFKVAKEEGVSVWLFHGPRVSKKSGTCTYADELWQEADERYEMDSSFMSHVQFSKSSKT